MSEGQESQAAAPTGDAAGPLDPRRAFAAMGEPTRFRILEVLAASASTVGGVAEAIGALQPQTTKHLQALEAAGLVTIHRLGRRRVVGLDRSAFASLASWLGEWAQPDGDDDALQAYGQAIAREGKAPGARAFALRAEVAAPADAVWRAWTDPALAARWWAPPHFDVRELSIAPDVGAAIRFVLGEPGGATYRSEGRVIGADPGRRLVFALAPIGETGVALFDAVHTVELRADGDATVVALRIEVDHVTPGATEAIAGLEQGWTQLLQGLSALSGDGSLA
ncbi:SRPBCC domain-containing protein [Microbacterium sp. 13-71-7]|jgi:uncharacterized protein YndB with AHSA1/START domain|uniref:SRPBCC domain-containing protein n=1 Tax=Microbacterium sp. 13-71-7 TaxID=1970399 RepID=UPI000BD9A1D4|nr:SRPBCC domain-containing protein [Microbacterium sp. 13-71-7]OZB85677.1 MAG: hypothetical protein B7X32_02480 [Microbacterium sp. 13-71-7]